MADEKVYTPEIISENPIPQSDGVVSLASSDSGSESKGYSASVIKPQNIPVKRTAVEIIGSVLNTMSRKILGVLEFTQSGAIQIGKYTNGVNGDIRISPNGIIARDLSGNTTFGLDGDTGNAVFKGQIQSGSLVTGEVVVGNNRIIIDGENQTIIVNDGVNDRVLIGYLPGKF